MEGKEVNGWPLRSRSSSPREIGSSNFGGTGRLPVRGGGVHDARYALGDAQQRAPFAAGERLDSTMR